jgi:SAM-dependent methyltransferase
MRVRDRLLDLMPEFSVVRCERCDLHFINPPPTGEELIKAYPDNYESYLVHRSREFSFIQRKSIRYGLRKRVQIVQKYKRRGRLLEIGCAEGLFLDFLRETGNWDTYGVEINWSAVQTARKQLGLNIFHGTLEEARLPDRDFDVVTMWDVLEHLPNPKVTLREIHRLLKPKGILVFRLPQFDCWERKVFGPYWSGWDPPRHLAVFSIKHLNRLLEGNGFKIVRSACMGGSYPALVLNVSFWGRDYLSPVVQGLLRKTLSSIPARILSAPFIKILDWLKVSSSLTIMAEKV